MRVLQDHHGIQQGHHQQSPRASQSHQIFIKKNKQIIKSVNKYIVTVSFYNDYVFLRSCWLLESMEIPKHISNKSICSTMIMFVMAFHAFPAFLDENLMGLGGARLALGFPIPSDFHTEAPKRRETLLNQKSIIVF